VDEEGRERPVRFFKGGDYFGETSLLVGEPRDVTVIARTDVEVFYLTKENFDSFLKAHPEVRKELKVREEIRHKWEAPRFDWLAPGEAVVWLGRRHWTRLLARLSGFFAFLIMVAFVLILLNRSPAVRKSIVVLFGLVGFLRGSWVMWDWANDRFIITNRRVCHIERIAGTLFSRIEAPLERVQDVIITIPLSGKAFDVGNARIETAGQIRGFIEFDWIKQPHKIREIVLEQKQRLLRWERAEERTRIRERLSPDALKLPPLPSSPPPPSPWFKWSKFLAREIREGDRIIWRTHYLMLLRRLVKPLLFGVIMFYSLYLLKQLGAIRCLFFPGTLAVLIWIMWLITAVWDWGNEQYIATPMGITDLKKKAIAFFIPIFTEERRDAPMESIQDISVRMGRWGIIFNMGDVVIETAAPAGKLVFENVHNPRRIQTQLFLLIQEHYYRQRRQEREQWESFLEDWFSVHRELDHARPRREGPRRREMERPSVPESSETGRDGE